MLASTLRVVPAVAVVATGLVIGAWSVSFASSDRWAVAGGHVGRHRAARRRGRLEPAGRRRHRNLAIAASPWCLAADPRGVRLVRRRVVQPGYTDGDRVYCRPAGRQCVAGRGRARGGPAWPDQDRPRDGRTAGGRLRDLSGNTRVDRDDRLHSRFGRLHGLSGQPAGLCDVR